MQLVIQWSTRSSGRTQVRSAQVKGRDVGERTGHFEGSLGKQGGEVVQVPVTGKDGTWGG